MLCICLYVQVYRDYEKPKTNVKGVGGDTAPWSMVPSTMISMLGSTPGLRRWRVI